MKNSLSSLFACFHAKYLMPYGLAIVLVFSVTALPDNARPGANVELAPTVIAALDVMTVPMNVLSAAIVVAPTGTQNTLALAAVAVPVNCTTALAAVVNVPGVRKMYTPGAFKLRIPVILIAPPAQYTPGPRDEPPRSIAAGKLTSHVRPFAQPTAVCISLTAFAIKVSEPEAVSYLVPTSVLGPEAGVIDGEPTLPVTEVGLVRLNAAPASTPKLVALPRYKGPGPAQLASGGTAVTVKVAEPALAPDVAVIVAVPADWPVATPGDTTVATGRVPEVHVTRLLMSTTLLSE